MIQPMRDREVRSLLLADLAHRHLGDGSTRIVEELGVLRGQRRVDVAVINGVLAGFEIKSDADDLSRLADQVAAYGAVFDEVTLVCGEHHLDSAAEIVPDWWGVVRVDADSGTLVTVRPPATNPGRSGYAIAQLMWRDELAGLLVAVDGPDLSKLRRRELLEMARDMPVDLIAEAARAALKARPSWRGGPQPS